MECTLCNPDTVVPRPEAQPHYLFRYTAIYTPVHDSDVEVMNRHILTNPLSMNMHRYYNEERESERAIPSACYLYHL